MKKPLLLALMSMSWPLLAGPVPDLRVTEVFELETAYQYGIFIEEVSHAPVTLFPNVQCGYTFDIRLSIKTLEQQLGPVNTLSFGIVDAGSGVLVWREVLAVDFYNLTRTFYLSDSKSYYLQLLVTAGPARARSLSVDISSLAAAAAKLAEQAEQDSDGGGLSEDCRQNTTS
jgi:hypothetical protein